VVAPEELRGSICARAAAVQALYAGAASPNG